MTLVPDHLRGVPYAGSLFIVLSAAALAGALLLMAVDHELVWAGAAALCLSAVISYILSRSVGLPSMPDDVGDWLNRLGIAAVACESAALMICSVVLWRARANRRPRLA